MKHAYTWGAILAVVLASTAGDVLLSRAMKKVGDVEALWRSAGLLTVAGRILRRPSFLLGIFMMAVSFFSLLFALSWGDVSLVAPASASLTLWQMPWQRRFSCTNTLIIVAGSRPAGRRR
jgi:hypothetical protein